MASAMTEHDPRHAELVAWLTEEGHTPLQIERILAKVAEYDSQTLHESIFDSIDAGEFNLAAIIDEALADEAT